MRNGRVRKPIGRLLHSSAAGFLSASLLAAPFFTIAGAPSQSWAADAIPSTPGSSSLSNDNSSASNANAWKGGLPITELSEDEAITHAQDRLGYGARPGDIERIRRMGLEKWISEQLHPETISDKPTEDRLGEFRTISMPATVLENEYPRPNVAAKRMGVTEEEYNKRMKELANPPQGMRPAEDRKPQVILNELMMAKLTRAIYSNRQLQEQLADFWFNHFNIYANKDQEVFLVGPFERDAIRPYLFGKFRDMLGATAHNAAMLVYLDNWLSADPAAAERAKHPTPEQKRAWKDLPSIGNKRGLNENYGRELMELHTLGVDGGYSQQDVIQVAKCFTGWTVRDPNTKPDFVFDPRIHDASAKTVLGKTIKAGGEKDGNKVLDLLAAQKATANHISHELAEHFVADNPPPALVARMAKTFEKSKGDLRETVRSMIYSPEFWSRAAYRAKIKTPFELVASAARALGADVDAPKALVGWVSQIGEPLYQYVAPTGYKDDAATWVNTGALLNRLNFAMTLAGNRLRGSTVDLPSRMGSDVGTDARAAMDRAVDTFLGGQISEASRATLEKGSSDPQIIHAKLDDSVRQIDLGVITGLVLGTPEFQRR